MSDFQFKIQHIPGTENIADYMSRNPTGQAEDKPASWAAENFINMIQDHFGPRAISSKEIIKATQADETLQALKEAMLI